MSQLKVEILSRFSERWIRGRKTYEERKLWPWALWQNILLFLNFSLNNEYHFYTNAFSIPELLIKDSEVRLAIDHFNILIRCTIEAWAISCCCLVLSRRTHAFSPFVTQHVLNSNMRSLTPLALAFAQRTKEPEIGIGMLRIAEVVS